MEGHLSELHESCFKANGASPAECRDLFLFRHPNDVVLPSKLGLRDFLRILKFALSPVSGSAKLGYQSWSDTHVESVISLGLAIISALRPFSSEEVDSVAVAIVQQLLEFTLVYLEKSKFDEDEFRIQSHVLSLMELAWSNGGDTTSSTMNYSCPLNVIQDLGQIVSSQHGDVETDVSGTWNFQGVNCSTRTTTRDWLLMSFESEFSDFESHDSGSCKNLDGQGNIFQLSLRWAVVHLDLCKRLINCVRNQIDVPEKLDHKRAGQDQYKRLSFGLRIIQLLRNVAEELPLVESDTSVLQEVISCLDALPCVFRIRWDVCITNATGEGCLENLLLLLLEEFLFAARVLFRNQKVFLNIQTGLVASMIGSLDPLFWRQDIANANLRPPLLCSPMIVVYMLKLIKDLKKLYCLAIDINLTGDDDTDISNADIFCHAHFNKISFLKLLTFEQVLGTVFSPSTKWLDNLMHLLLFLYTERHKLGNRNNKPQSNVLKTSGSIDSATTVPNEEEALFGDLFSEGGRPASSIDDQFSVGVSSSSNKSIPLQAASELLDFLKDCIFSREWSPMLFSSACKNLKESHIEIFLSFVNSHMRKLDDRDSDGCSVSFEEKRLNIQHRCFCLLEKLLICHALSDHLEEYLFDQILKVEDGKFIYNKHSLCLLSYLVTSRVGSYGSKLRIKLYNIFTEFIMAKANALCLQMTTLKDLMGSVPVVFHMEILLVAFHLSSEIEKGSIARMVFNTLQSVDSPPENSSISRLTCWALVISRLIVLLQHMVSYPIMCPPFLLYSLKSYRKGVSNSSQLSPKVSNDQPCSWASSTLKKMAEPFLDHELLVCSLADQLIEFSARPLLKRELTITSLQLSSNDLAAIYSKILGFWKRRKALNVEDLIIERYLSSLCTNISITISASDYKLSAQDLLKAGDFSNMSTILNVICLIIGQNVSIRGISLIEIVLEVLKYLCVADMPETVEDLGWDFLRSGLWVSLFSSLLNVGFCHYCLQNHITGINPSWIEKEDEDHSFTSSAGNLVHSFIQTGHVSMVLSLLSVLLTRYLNIYQKAVFASASDCGSDASVRFILFLLKHSCFEDCEQNEVLKTSSVNVERLKSMVNALSKVGNVDGGAPGIFSRTFQECLIHGFPINEKVSSACLVSCIICIKRIISVFKNFFLVDHWGNDVCIDKEVVQNIVDSVIAIKLDGVFGALHSQCDQILIKLYAGTGCSELENIVLLKQMLELLRNFVDMNSEDTLILEWVIPKIIDMVVLVKKNAVKSDCFQMDIKGVRAEESVYDSTFRYGVDFMFLLNSLDHCFSESINVKVLSFFVDILSESLSSDLRLNLERKYLGMDLLNLSIWFKFRLLGSIVESEGVAGSAKGCSLTLRETTIKFIFALYSSPSEHQIELQDHIFESLLKLLDEAFLAFDAYIAMNYFYFVVQLASRKSLMQLLLKNTTLLMEKLASEERYLSGLKIIFGFLGTILSERGSIKSTSGRSSLKPVSGSSLGTGTMSATTSESRSSETLVLSSGHDPGSTNQECDATSVDEDEDDGTSDGEVASMEKDDDEDSSSEKALASKVCTFTSSGSNYMEQHWYFCYTCDLTVSKGCCSICAKVCHYGHRVVYSRSSRFFCDCGAGGVRGSGCQCLKPRKYPGSTNVANSVASSFQNLLPFSEEPEHMPESDSDMDDEMIFDAENNSMSVNLAAEIRYHMSNLFEEFDVESQVLQLCSSLLPSIINRRDADLAQEKNFFLGQDRTLIYGSELLHLKKAYKSGSFDLKIKIDYSNTKELKSLLANGFLAKSLLSVSNRGRLAVGEGDKVAIYDVGQLIGQATIAPVTADKNNVKPVSRNIVRFEIVQISFNPAAENYLAVAGYEDCQVLALNPRGDVIDRLAIELVLQGAYIKKIDWVPGSQVKLMVVTNRFIKIYDLSLDNISPAHYCTLPDKTIVDATIITMSQGRMFLVVLSEVGCLFSLELNVERNVGVTPLNNIIKMEQKEMASKGSSLYYCASLRILFVAYDDGTVSLTQLSHDMMSVACTSFVHEEQDGKIKSTCLHHWIEMLGGNGLFACVSGTKPNSALALLMKPEQFLAQNLRHTLSSTSLLVGLTSYKPLSKDKVHCLLLYDDGSLHIYSHVPAGADGGTNIVAEKVKKLGSGLLNSKVYAGVKPEFPLDFFEKTVCITSDVKLGGDALRNGDSEAAKQSLASEDGFLEAPSTSGFKIIVSNSNPDIVMVGLRIHVGNTSFNHIPSEIVIFQRAIKLDEGMRCWYDVPFTTAESLLADEEFIIYVGKTFSGTTTSRIDSLEIYGRAKDEFGWKEKLDALLDMESPVMGGKSLVGLSDKKCRVLRSSLMQEQVVADGLHVLSALYSLRRLPDDDVAETKRLKSQMLLEKIFESEREPLLQSAASRVLHAAFPNKESYYQVKDNMRLNGVLKSTSAILSRLTACSFTASGITAELTAQMRSVSKISLNRCSNLATFLEINGSAVIDGLMQALWEILEFKLDTQMLNSIVMSSVELMYCYAECLASHGKHTEPKSVTPAVILFKKLLSFPSESVQSCGSLAISSRLLQVPFPKQTMMSADDHGDNMVAAGSAEPATTGNGQVLIEEDSTFSAHYCCDGCSTVPILRRRWHCTVCPDFDLCEACYQVLDADHLPPPHSRDHPMTAIPIVAESFGDGGEIHYSASETNESNLLPVTSDKSLQNSSSPIHTLEASCSEGFSTLVADTISISASKQVINSLILSELLDQLKGWMTTTSGHNAIPVMQLFYKLSSAAGGPFMNSLKPEILDLQKLVRWLLDEMDLGKPFVAKARSSFGEVTILVFMYFTLMLRNWPQPGSDTAISRSVGGSDSYDRNIAQTPSTASHHSMDSRENNDLTSQLLQACSYLRSQTFATYLMDILQQLVHIFRSPVPNLEIAHNSNSAAGCGALLTIRRDFPAGNYSPFFSDSYAKTHQTDMFMDYHRLLLENTFRLIYSLVRPEKQDRMADREKTHRTSYINDLKLDGYHDVLCSYINNPNTSFVRRYARRLFLHLCGSKTHYYSIRDSWQYSSELRKLQKHINKSGGVQNVVSYERSVKMVKCLSTMSEVAVARPRNWQKYCLKHVDVLPFLINGVFYFCEESVIPTLKLLNLAFYTGKDQMHSMQKIDAAEATNSDKPGLQSGDSKKKRKNEDGSDEKPCLDMESGVEIFNDKDGNYLKRFIDSFLLEWNSSSVRSEAKYALYGAWNHGKYSFKKKMLTFLLQRIRDLSMYSQNIVEFTALISLLLGKVLNDNESKQQHVELVDNCLSSDVINSIFETLHLQNELIANHPNSRIYSTLSNLVEFDGYYLESEPCVACSSPEVPYSKMKLESLKSETKFTDNRIIVKCTGSYTIQTVTMNVHDARKSKSVKVLNLYYNNRPVADLSELKNNWSLWKRAKSCHLFFNQTELKVEFPIPITACNFMIELDSFYENLQALSLESLQCPRCSRPVTDRHGICNNCHENAYQCRQCRNINYENLDSFLCNECGYSKYGRFEFNFMAKPSFIFDNMENDEDMRRGLAAIESESENAHRRYQQLLGFKKPLLKLVSSIGENEMDSQQKDAVQQMMLSLPGPSCRINRKIAVLGVLYGEKCKAAFDSVSKSVQTLQGLRRVLMSYLHLKHSDNNQADSRLVVSRSPNNCYGCATTFVMHCMEILQVLSKRPVMKKQLVAAGILSELFENNIHQGSKSARMQARAVLCSFSEGDIGAVTELNNLIQKKVFYCLEHHRSMDIALATREELLLLSEFCTLTDEFWEARLRVVFQLLFASIKSGAKHPAISEQIILPCLRIISRACTSPKPEAIDKERKDETSSTAVVSLSGTVCDTMNIPESSEKSFDAAYKTHDIQLVNYSEWERGCSYLDFIRRQYKVAHAIKGGQKSRSQRHDYLTLKYFLRWKRNLSKRKYDLSLLEVGSWVTELALSDCSQSIRSEMCILIGMLCAENSSRQSRLLNLLLALLPATLAAGDSAAEYFDLLFKMIDSEDARLFLTVRGCLYTICKLITQEVGNVEALERSLRIDISQGFILHKLVELLGKFLEIPNIRIRFMHDNLLPDVLESLIVIRGLVVQKTRLISDCNRLLNDLLDGLLIESAENKRQFIRACIRGLQNHGEERKGRTSLFILEQLCNLIFPSKPESVYLLILNKAHTQEEFIRGSMTKNPYSSAEIGPLMRDVKNKICNQLELLGLLEDDYGMELLVAGNIISLDLSIVQVFEQVWRKSNNQTSTLTSASLLSLNNATSLRDCPPMTVTYRLQGLDGEATEPMIKELEEDREESQDPEVEFAIAGAVREYGGLEILLSMIQRLRDDFRSNQEQLVSVLNLLMHCCKIRENRRALLRLSALGLLLETARRAFSVDAIEPAEGILLIVESLTLEANESDNISITQGALTVTNEETGMGEQAKKIVLMFLERLSHPLALKKSSKQQRNTEMVARILPYLTYGEPAAMEALIQHFEPYLKNWQEFDRLQLDLQNNSNDEITIQKATEQRLSIENFVRVSESLKTSSCGERLKDIILERAITDVAIRHLSESFAVTGQAGFKSTAKWSSSLKLPSVPHILSMLRGLSMGHIATQKRIDEGGILFLLHALEGVSGENEIGARAENLLDTLSNKEGKGDGFLEEKVQRLRCATRDEMKRRALKKREELLKGLGMRQELSLDGGERIVVAQPALEGFEDVEEEEDGLACMVCREGYNLRPTDLLGVYSYSKRVNLGVGISGSARGECVYTTVSFFNIIHFQCHQEAKRADSALKNPKKEWEGATLRNNESLCNSLFPIRGSSVPLTQYVRCVDQYWDNLNALGRADGSRLRLLIYDIVLMLARFATGASFSTESRGGGRESNSRFLPFMIQMARFLLEQGSPSQKQGMAKAMSSYIGGSSPSSDSRQSSGQPAQGAEETVQFMMVNSLLSESYQYWVQHRRDFLQRGVYHAYMQHTHGRSSTRSSAAGTSTISVETSSPEDLLPIIRPMLVYTGLVEQLQRFFKVKNPGCAPAAKDGKPPAPSEGEEIGGNLESWEVVMKERLLNFKGMTGFSKEVLAWLDEITTATDLQEAFDMIGLLPDVLSNGTSSCEDFVRTAINTGKA